MAAKSGPKGSVVEKHGKSDVNQSAASSTAAESNTESVVESQEAAHAEESSSLESEVDDSVLEDLKESGKVPYSRFKEVNEKAKKTEQQLLEMQQKFAADLQKAQEDAEIRAEHRARKQTPDDDIESETDPYLKTDKILQRKIEQLEAKLNGVEAKNSEENLKRQIKELQQVYPDANDLAALGIKKAAPGMSLDSIMQTLHEQANATVQLKLQRIVEQKKAKAKQAIPTRESVLRLKDDQKPKTVKEAGQLLKKFLGG